jgi:hypothetical protein
MTFKEYLTELFDRPAKIYTLADNLTDREAIFTVGNNKYSIYLSKEPIRKIVWNVTFAIIEIDGMPVGGIDSIKTTNLNVDKNVVFATVIKFIESHHRKEDTYKFTTWKIEKSRIRLYDTLSKRLAKKYNMKVEKSVFGNVIEWQLS